MTNELNTIAEELRTTAISKLPEAISVSEGDCILVVQNRKAKRARPSLFRGPKGDTGMTGAPGTIGPTGASPVLRYTTRGIESKLSNQPDTEFTLLVPIADMTGPQGTTGANIVLRAGDTGIEFKLSTEPDSAYKVLVPYLQITGPKGNTGPAPILELGEVTTVEPSDPASATFQPNGIDPSGANKYRLALSIPKGKSGQDGTGAGNVLVNNEASLLASKQYTFKPGQDGSVNGAFVEVEATGGAIEIPMGITDLDTSSTSEQILAVWPMEDILKVIKGKPGGVYYTYMDGATVYVQVISTVSEDPAVTPHDAILSISVISPGQNIMQVVSLGIETDESIVSITGVVYDIIGNFVNAHDPNRYSGVLVPVKNKETGTVMFNPWYNATSYQYVILNIDDLKTDTSAQIKEKLGGLPIIMEWIDTGNTEFSALCYTLSSYGSVIGATHSGSLMFMDSSIVGESSVAMYFKGGDTLYTVTISEDPTTKDLSATVVESNMGQLETAGDGSKFLSNDGTYKAISSGAGNVYNLDIDISGVISGLTPEQQTAIFGKTYIAPTNDNIIELLGGTEGIRQLCEKLKPANNPIVTVPYMLYTLPTRLVSTSVSVLICDSSTNPDILPSLEDGCYINIGLMFYSRTSDPICITVSIVITNFNTDTQVVVYEYVVDTELVDIEDSLSSGSLYSALSANQGRILKERIDKKVGSEEITTIKKLTQAAYDSLSPKDSKTLYACIQTNGTIVMR